MKQLILGLGIVMSFAACSDSGPTSEALAMDSEQSNATEEIQESISNPKQEIRYEPGDLPEDLALPIGFKQQIEPWTGDLDGMAERRVIRILTIYASGTYFLDGPEERGITYEFFKMFEKELNESLDRGHLKVHVLFVPVLRDMLLPMLVKGRGDIAAASLTITPEREQLVDFSNPVAKNVSEILVTGPSAPSIESLDDLGGQVVMVRQSSSYRESLELLNERLSREGKPLVELHDASELMEDSDLLEMVNSGMIPWVVVDSYKAKLWADVFTSLIVRDDLVLRSGGKVGMAIRKNNPQLMAFMNEFVKTHKQGTLLGNILMKRYMNSTDWTKNALAQVDYQRFLDLEALFDNYGRQYGFDYLMVAAQGYQESRLDQKAKSSAGAIGIMQLLPSTAADPNVGISDISTAESNIHAGVKYLDFIRKRYFSDPTMDLQNQTLFALAAYNAGPARVRGLRAKAADMGLDPNIWFSNVEVVAAKEIGRETVQYVANIYKYYLAYSLSTLNMTARANERAAHGLENQ